MSHVSVAALAWALVHFIWQGAAVALAAGFASAALRRARPATRYAVLCGALAAMAILPFITFLAMRPSQANASVPAASLSVASVPALGAGVSIPGAPAEPVWIAWLVGIWLSGVVLLGLRSLGGWVWAQQLKSGTTSPAAESFQRAAQRLRAGLGIRRAVRILSTASAEVPATLGWLRPVVLLPVSVFTALTPEQIELLLAHELAHVRRHDYLVNLAQTAVETVLFYHPAVWWLSGRIRAEREHCCDDLAVAACGDVATYVRALATLEGLRGARPALVVAADGGSLLDRIQRLLDREPRRHETPPAWLGALLPAALLLAAVGSTAPPQAVVIAKESVRETTGFLGGLTDAGYTKLSVDEIIALKEHGVEPPYIKSMRSAGLGVPNVEQLIRVREHGVTPAFAEGMAQSGLVSNLGFETVIRLHEQDARGDDMARIRSLGFGPFTADDVIRLRQHGVDATTFETLKEIGLDRAGVSEAIEVRRNDVTVERIRSMKRQGFGNLSLDQIVKLRRAGII